MMMTEKLMKTAGWSLIASGILVTLGFSIHPHDPIGANYVPWIFGHVLILLGFAAALFGLIGLYGVLAEGAGLTGAAGFLLASISLILDIGKLYWSGFIYPLVIDQHPDFIVEHGLDPGSRPTDPVVEFLFYLGPILFGLGYTLLGWVVLKARAFPSLPVRLVILGALLVGLWPLLPEAVQHFSMFISLIFTIGIAWIGYLLATGKHSRC